jgi:hypothetical protein
VQDKKISFIFGQFTELSAVQVKQFSQSVVSKSLSFPPKIPNQHEHDDQNEQRNQNQPSNKAWTHMSP